MAKALRDNKPLRYFGDIWLSVLNDTVDSQADFQASKLQSNMDFTSKPGYALLAKQADAVNQLSYNDTSTYPIISGRSRWQSFLLYGGRFIDNIIVHAVWGDVTTFEISIWTQGKDVQIASGTVSVSGTASQEITVTFQDVYLDPGMYWFKVTHGGPNITFVAFQNSDVYADGEGWHYYMPGPLEWSYLGDHYFKLNMQKYQASGSFRTKRVDLGETPPSFGNFQMAYSHPQGTQLAVTLYGYTLADDTSPAVTITGAADGTDIPAYRYWEVLVEMASNAALDKTPQIDMLEFLFPKSSIKLTEKDQALRHVEGDILHTYQPLLTGVDYKSSDIKILDRVASGGEISATLEDVTGETITRMISDSPLKNYRAILYIGADVPGFSEGDLLRFFIGTVQAAKYRPKYRRGFYSLSLTFKNPILELKRKVPLPAATGAVTLADTSINYDGTHMMDASLDLLRGRADIPARYLNLESIAIARESLGDASLPAAAHVVRRSNAAGLPDTRIKSPEEVGKLLSQIAILADVYWTEDEDSRITVVKHDTAAPVEAVWANESLIRKAGVDAIAIEDVGEIDLGYETLLFNGAMFGCEWDGTGSDWTAFSKVYANVNSESVDEFAPGKAIFLSMMEKNLVDASKWLGPQAGYNGETIAQALAQRYVTRFAWPPVVMTGVVMPNTEFMLTKGAVVQVWDPEFTKFRRRGIALSETLKFMVLSKKPDRAKNRMIFSLLELT